MKYTMITLAAVLASVLADPAVIFNGGLYSSYPSYASAALLAPGAAQIVAPVGQVAPVAPVASVGPIAPLTSTLADYSYAYGSSLTYQDRYLPSAAVVNSAYSLPYNVPYAYSSDYFYRK